MSKENRINFSSKMAVVAAAAGSAVGLGNIWRFPYELGQYGGAAFLVLYILFVVALGIPIMLSEFAIGRMGQTDAVGSFRKIAPRRPWWLVGVMGVVSAFLIMGFYSVVSGWTFEYIYQAFTNQFAGKDSAALSASFSGFSSHPFRPVFWAFVFMAISAGIVLLGVKDGIEKSTKFMMPLLFVIIIALGVRSVTLPGGIDGLRFLFHPDFSKITSSVVLSAMGQAFFSLSLGMGCMITYGSYVSKKNNLNHTVAEVTILDTLVAVLAAVAIFPAAFALGVNPGQGPELVFITLPSVFAQLPGGQFWAVLFFILLSLAAMTSIISLLEVVVAYITEEFKLRRKPVTIFVTLAVMVLSVVSSLSFGVWKDITIFGMTFFDLFDTLTSKVMMPLGGLLISLFAGWVIPVDKLRAEISNEGQLKLKLFNVYLFLIRYIAPLGIVLVMFNF